MAHSINQMGYAVTVSTWNAFNSYTYRKRVYETPDGDSVIVNDGDLTRKVQQILKQNGYDIRSERPTRYLWEEGPMSPGPSHKGIFTIKSHRIIGEESGENFNEYTTDCGTIATKSSLKVGETYKICMKDAQYFEYRKVNEE